MPSSSDKPHPGGFTSEEVQAAEKMVASKVEALTGMCKIFGFPMVVLIGLPRAQSLVRAWSDMDDEARNFFIYQFVQIMKDEAGAKSPDVSPSPDPEKN